MGLTDAMNELLERSDHMYSDVAGKAPQAEGAEEAVTVHNSPFDWIQSDLSLVGFLHLIGDAFLTLGLGRMEHESMVESSLGTMRERELHLCLGNAQGQAVAFRFGVVGDVYTHVDNEY